MRGFAKFGIKNFVFKYVTWFHKMNGKSQVGSFDTSKLLSWCSIVWKHLCSQWYLHCERGLVYCTLHSIMCPFTKAIALRYRCFKTKGNQIHISYSWDVSKLPTCDFTLILWNHVTNNDLIWKCWLWHCGSKIPRVKVTWFSSILRPNFSALLWWVDT